MTCSERRVCPQMGTKPFSMRSAFQPCHGPGAYQGGWDVGMLGCWDVTVVWLDLTRFDLDHLGFRLGFRLGSEIILDIDLQRRVDTAKTLTSEQPEVSIQSHCISPLQLESSGVARRCSCLQLSWWHHRDITPWTFVYLFMLCLLFVYCLLDSLFVAQKPLQPLHEVTPAQGARQALHPMNQRLGFMCLNRLHLPYINV